VRRLIADHLDSVAQLEALLLLRAAPERAWTPADVSRALVTRPEPAARLLEHLHEHGLTARDDGSGGHRYAPAAVPASVVDALAECYATRRPTIVGLVFAPRPSDAAQTFADAFRLRRER